MPRCAVPMHAHVPRTTTPVPPPWQLAVQQVWDEELKEEAAVEESFEETFGRGIARRDMVTPGTWCEETW